MGGTVDIGIFVGVEICQTIDNRLWFLRGGGVVQPNQRPAVDAFLQNREIAPNGGNIKLAAGKIGQRGSRQ